MNKVSSISDVSKETWKLGTPEKLEASPCLSILMVLEAAARATGSWQLSCVPTWQP